MATYVMSDIHGKLNEYLEMLLEIGFSNKDKLYILGDVIDRGEEPIKLLEKILYSENVELLMGNHEKMMLDSASSDERKRLSARDMWEWNGGHITVSKYVELPKSQRQWLLDKIAALKWYKIVEVGNKKFFLSHAGLCMRDEDTLEDTIRAEIDTERILWNRSDLLFWKNTSDCIFIHGHTPSGKWHPEGKYEIYHYEDGKKINIDCGCAKNKNLGCLRLDDMKEFYIECEKPEWKDDTKIYCKKSK